MLKTVLKSAIGATLLFSTMIGAGVLNTHLAQPVKASDHDDGESNIKSRNLNLTDLFVFREDWQTGVAADAANLIFVMNSNPRSLPRQQYFFNTQALYNFHVSKRADRSASVTGQESTRFEFSFGAPDANQAQNIRLQVHNFANGAITGTQTFANAGTTVPLNAANPNAATTVATANGNLSVFAGLREDPFFFDVDAFFRTRAFLKTGSPGPVARTLLSTNAATSIDFAKGYNVNTIVMRVPISLLQAGGTETSFDTWETIAVPTAVGQLQ
jgi:hypothetical protein